MKKLTELDWELKAMQDYPQRIYWSVHSQFAAYEEVTMIPQRIKRTLHELEIINMIL